MNIEWVSSPYSQHNNILFGFIKKSLIDSQIYDTTPEAFSYTDKAKKYKLKLSNCSKNVLILVNDQTWIAFDGSTSSTGILEFYIAPRLGKNEIKIVSTDKLTLYTKLNFSCYNFHIFLAYTSKKFKELWNFLYQARANITYDQQIIQDLDGNYLNPDRRYTRAFSTLMGTKRYSKLSDLEYSTFLHNCFDFNMNASTYSSYYSLQKALSTYIDRIDLIPLEEYLVQRSELRRRLYRGTDNTSGTKLLNTVKVYPNYIFINNEWGILPYYNQAPDSTAGFVSYVYVDGEKYTDGSNIGHLKIKFSNNAEFFKTEISYTDRFNNYDFYDDTSGGVTGYIGGKYVVLRKPNIDGTISSVDTTGKVGLNTSARYISEPKYNYVDLGTLYRNEIDNVAITYKTYDTPVLLGKLEKDTTTNAITNILMSGIAVDGTMGDKVYLSAKEDNFGSIVIVIRASQVIDNELKDILSILIRNALPIHLKYYLVISTENLWDYWGQTNFTFADTTTLLKWTNVTFGDLK